MDLEQKVSAARCPAHLLLFDHARADDQVDRGLGERNGDGLASTDTTDASEIVFAQAWAFGYRWAPDWPTCRPSALAHRPHARYGPLNGLARHRINTCLIAEY